jgi:2-methylisocitrate lyase-like PEP mutase family enzyme
MPGVFDALSARLAVEAGFEVLFASGFAVSAAHLGLPDLGYLTPTEMAGVARPICAAVKRPVIVDADTGYGNALSAQRTARELHRAGAAGIMLEDQEWPKRCGHMDGKSVVAADEWLAKLRAVVDLRDEGIDLFLIARTDAAGPLGLDEAIARACAARDVGADAAFVEAPRNEDDLRRIAAEVPGVSLMANMVESGKTPLLTPDELRDLGFHLVVTPLTALLAATQALREALTLLRHEGTPRDHPELGVSFGDMLRVVDLPRHQATDARYRGESR